MDMRGWRCYTFILIIVASIQYHILALIEMGFYEGGTLIDPFCPGYSFFSNFLSDLGRLTAFSGIPNGISCLLFTIHSSFYGISFVLLFLALPNLFRSDSKEKMLSIIGSSLNIIAGGALVGIALTPWDILPNIHQIFFALALVTTFFAAILYYVAIYLNQDYSNRYAYVFLIFGIFVAPYTICLIFCPSMYTPVGLIFQVTGQKILTYLWAISFSIIGYSAFKFSSKSNENKNSFEPENMTM